MADQADALQQVVRRNIKILMAVRGIEGARQLAKLTGTSENWISQKQSGRRRWHLDDLPTIARALGVQSIDLLRRDAAEVVGATKLRPAASGSSGTLDATIRYKSHTMSHSGSSSPLVGGLPSDMSAGLAPVIQLAGRRPRSVDRQAPSGTTVTRCAG